MAHIYRKIGICIWGMILLMICFQPVSAQHHHSHTAHRGSHPFVWLSSKVIEKDSTGVAFATVYLQGTNYGSSTDGEGYFRFKVPVGTHTLAVSFIGYESIKKNITVNRDMKNLIVVLQQEATKLEEVVVTGGAVSRIRKSPFNAVAIDTKALSNTTKNLSEALSQLPGMKLRESGGVGSDMQLMLDGFSGKHIKIFIDGVPQEGAGQAFDLNNIPADFAERIEVYKGVVPVGFGSDAIGGVVNVVTNKRRRGWHADASYSYGSFNTHRSGHVRTQGYNVSLRYSFARRFDLGGTWNSIDTRDYERRWTGASQQENMHYKVRLPNIPYRFANFDAAFHWRNLFAEGNTLTASYDGFWQHGFPLG